MAYTPNAADSRLAVEFYSKEITKGSSPRSEDWVRILQPGDSRMEHHAPALAVWAPVNGKDVTYAERFAPQFQAFKSGDADRKRNRVDELRKQLAAAESEQFRPAIAPVTSGPDFSDMSDDELREFIADKTGKDVPGNVTKRETLERIAQEAAGG